MVGASFVPSAFPGDFSMYFYQHSEEDSGTIPASFEYNTLANERWSASVFLPSVMKPFLNFLLQFLVVLSEPATCASHSDVTDRQQRTHGCED